MCTKRLDKNSGQDLVNLCTSHFKHENLKLPIGLIPTHEQLMNSLACLHVPMVAINKGVCQCGLVAVAGQNFN